MNPIQRHLIGIVWGKVLCLNCTSTVFAFVFAVSQKLQGVFDSNLFGERLLTDSNSAIWNGEASLFVVLQMGLYLLLQYCFLLFVAILSPVNVDQFDV